MIGRSGVGSSLPKTPYRTEDNMELGNMLFGNSRGEYKVPRHAAYEGELLRLFRHIEKDNGYGPEFVNDVFEIHPYWWGDCSCGKDQRDEEQRKEYLAFVGEDHDTLCIQRELYAWDKDNPRRMMKKDYDKFMARGLKPIFQKYGLPTTGKNWWHGFMCLCTCGHYDRARQWEADHPHADTCGLVRPNFLFKPAGYELRWYKYPLRDSYSSHNLSIEQFEAMIDACLESL